MSTFRELEVRESKKTVHFGGTVDGILHRNFKRLIGEAIELFTTREDILRNIIKRTWIKQLKSTTSDEITFGFITFTARHDSLTDTKYDLDKVPLVPGKLTFSLHLKQTTTPALGKQLSSGMLTHSIVYPNDLYDFDKPDVVLQHQDAEAIVLFKDLVTEVQGQLETFSLNEDTFVSQQELSRIKVRQ